MSGPCTLGFACPSGMVCDRASGQCVAISGPCTTDVECTPPATVCESRQCIPGCGQAGGLQCVGAMTCDANSGRCLGDQPCIGDVYEENDTFETAHALGPGALSGLTLCPGDDDYYAITLSPGRTLTATLTVAADSAEGAIDLELYDSMENWLAGASPSALETLSYRSLTGGTYTVRAHLAEDTGSALGASYALDLEIAGSDCRDDIFEDNDIPGVSFPLPPDFLTNLYACPADDDYYSFSLQGGAPIGVTVSADPAEGTMGLELSDFFGLPVATGVSAHPGELSLTYTPPLGDLYYVRVWLASDAGSRPGNAYSMTVNLGTTMSSCTDAFEENDTPSSAHSAPFGRTANLTVCDLDDDYYSVSLAFGQTITVSAAFTHAEGDIDMALLDAFGNIVAISESALDGESFIFNAVSAGTYTIRVYLWADLGLSTGNTYELTVN